MVRIHIDSIAFGGEGVGRIDGAVVFVRGGLTGEDLTVKITDARKNFFRGEIVEILAKSPARVEPRCPYFDHCGGCQYLHLDYPAQAACKTGQVKDILRRMGGFQDIDVDAIPSPKPFHYRNKVTFNIDRVGQAFETGFIGLNNIDLVPVASCLIADEDINARIPAIQEELNNLEGLIPKTVTLRKTAGGAVDHFYDSDEGTAKHAITEEIGHKRFEAPLSSFFQVNSEMIPAMVNAVAAELSKARSPIVIDSYCGAGILGIAASAPEQRLIGIDSDENSIACARKNALKNGLKQTVFFAERTEKHLDKLLQQNPGRDISLILDPPREGCDRKVMEHILKHKPARIVYVSCNPPTLARDLKLLKDAYHLQTAAFIDMFPQTKHCEVVAGLTLLSHA
jgi:23S rRNA (uracil1939-C5)-methyltransferase